MAGKPEITVAALIERDGQFLVVEESIGGRIVLNQPAGHVENGETLESAVVRETLEETAWHFAPEALLGLYLWRNPRGHSTLRIAFVGALAGFDAQRPLDPPVLRTHWLSRGELAARVEQLRTPLVMRCVDDYLAGRRLPLTALVTMQSVA
jgi:8-oxo-dGTP pyrophosphatase MutT (NUDIX family)